MRVTLEQTADYFRADFDEIARVAKSGCVALDEQGTVNLMLAQALVRYVSDEFVEIFGTNQAFVARDIGFVEAEYFDRVARLLPAELGLLDAVAMGLAPGGAEVRSGSWFGRPRQRRNFGVERSDVARRCPRQRAR